MILICLLYRLIFGGPSTLVFPLIHGVFTPLGSQESRLLLLPNSWLEGPSTEHGRRRVSFSPWNLSASNAAAVGEF